MALELLQSSVFQKPTVENSIWYNGHTFSFLINAEQTDGAFTLIYCSFRKGGEPPAHFHTNEDETFYMLDGQIQFHVGDKRVIVQAGDVVYAPRNIPHQFNLITDTAKALLLITPSGIETFFREFGQPALSLDLPPIPEGHPPAVFFENMTRRAEELGIVWLPEF
jgi:quercetin dioxygenase-like cupin family protein